MSVHARETVAPPDMVAVSFPYAKSLSIVVCIIKIILILKRINIIKTRELTILELKGRVIIQTTKIIQIL